MMEEESEMGLKETLYVAILWTLVVTGVMVFLANWFMIS